MVDDYIIIKQMLDEVLDKIKEIKDIEKVDVTEIMIDIDYKLGDEITIQNVVIIISCIIKNYDNIYQQLFEEESIRSIKVGGKLVKY